MEIVNLLIQLLQFLFSSRIFLDLLSSLFGFTLPV